MIKIMLTSLLCISLLHCEQPDNYNIKVLESQEKETFTAFCNTQFASYQTPPEEKICLGGWSLDKAIQRLPNRDKYNTCIIAYMKDDCCIAVISLKLHKNNPDSSLEYLYDTANPTTHSFNYALIELVFVAPEYRRQGLACQLIQQACQHCKKLNLKQILIISDSTNTSMLNLYKKLNFSQVDPNEKMLFTPYPTVIENIKNMKTLIFSKQLDAL